MSTLTNSVRNLEVFFSFRTDWFVRLHGQKYRALRDVTFNTELWEDYFTFRYGLIPHRESPLWDRLFQKERAITALRVIEHRHFRRR
jgi:hypothetical protein